MVQHENYLHLYNFFLNLWNVNIRKLMNETTDLLNVKIYILDLLVRINVFYFGPLNTYKYFILDH
jgi:hypothetical protein